MMELPPNRLVSVDDPFVRNSEPNYALFQATLAGLSRSISAGYVEDSRLSLCVMLEHVGKLYTPEGFRLSMQVQRELARIAVLQDQPVMALGMQDEALRLALVLGDYAEQVASLCQMAYGCALNLQLTQALAHAARATRLALQHNLMAGLGVAVDQVAFCCVHAGDFEAAHRYLRLGLAVLEPLPNRYPYVALAAKSVHWMCRAFDHYRELDQEDQAALFLQRAGEIATLTIDTEDVALIAQKLWQRGLLNWQFRCGDREGVIDGFNELARWCSLHGCWQFLRLLHLDMAHIYWALGQWQAAVTVLELDVPLDSPDDAPLANVHVHDYVCLQRAQMLSALYAELGQPSLHALWSGLIRPGANARLSERQHARQLVNEYGQTFDHLLEERSERSA